MKFTNLVLAKQSFIEGLFVFIRGGGEKFLISLGSI
jgi:hypothetical protein